MKTRWVCAIWCYSIEYRGLPGLGGGMCSPQHLSSSNCDNTAGQCWPILHLDYSLFRSRQATPQFSLSSVLCLCVDGNSITHALSAIWAIAEAMQSASLTQSDELTTASAQINPSVSPYATLGRQRETSFFLWQFIYWSLTTWSQGKICSVALK